MPPPDAVCAPFDWVGEVRPRFFDGFHRSIPAMAGAGNDLIVDHIIEYASWRTRLAELLDGLDVFLVGVHCDPAELARRERARGDRREGEAASHLEGNRIHALGAYDLDVDTTGGVTPGLIERVVAAWRARSGPGALRTSSE